jgi:hypothetical protein
LATRWFFPETEAAAVSPTISAEWEHQNVVRRRLRRSVDSSTLTTTSYAPDGADDITDKEAHHRQYVSDSLPAQTISGNVKAQFQGLEAHANNNLFLCLKIFVVNQAGTVVTGTLLAITRTAVGEYGTALINQTFPSTALSSLAINENDRLVVEVGLAGNSGPASGGVQGHNGSLRWGCSAAGGDLPENNTDTGTTLRPWIEFSNTILTAKVTVAATAVGVAARSTKLVFKTSVAATAIGVATQAERLIFKVTRAATAVGVATVTVRLMLKRSFAAIAVGVATVGTLFIPGAPAPGGDTFQIGKVPVKVFLSLVAGIVQVWRTVAGPGVVPVHTVTVDEAGVVPVKEEASGGPGIVPIVEA